MLVEAYHGAAILGDLMLGDIHAAHDLQAGDDGALQVSGDGEHLVEQTVDTHTNHHFALLGLEVDVAGALAEGTLDEGVDEADGGRGLGIVRAGDKLGGDDVAVRAAGLTLHLLDDAGRALVAVERGNGLLRGAAGGDHGDDLLAGGGLQLLLGNEVQRVAHGHVQLVLYQLDGDDAVFFGDGAGDVFGQLHGDGDAGQVDVVHAQLHLQRVDELVLGDDAAVDEQVAQALAAGFLGLQRGLKLFIGDRAGGDEQVAQTHIGHKSVSFLDGGRGHSKRL